MKTAEERKQYRRQQYLKHKDREKETRREYLIKNREKVLEKQKKYNKENPLKRKNAVLKNVYGITLVQYNEMFETQEGKCAICQRHQNELTRTLCVDHDHKTNKVRALLCVTCNTDVSVVENRLEEMTNYLNKYRKDLN
jgi:F0F1-type ATP synthase alpha subunit